MSLELAGNWAKKEFKRAELWDKRCTKSIIKIAEAISDKPELSFSAACGKTLRQNGGRIMSDKKMSTEKMLAGHYKETAKRARDEAVVLCAQDTTSMNYSSHKATTGLGTISHGVKAKGIEMHTVLALREDGLPLGLIGQKQWVRPEDERGKKHKRKELPIEEKESNKWLYGLECVNDRLKKVKGEIYVISDRESDIFEYFVAERNSNVHLLVRATQPRLIEAEIEGSKVIGKLQEIVKSYRKVAEKEVEIERENRTLKTVVSISYGNIEIKPPKDKAGRLKPVRMTAIYVEEKDAAGKEDKIEWILLLDKTDLTDEESVKTAGYYVERWKVERFHYTLKTGVFNVEKLQFDDAETLMNALAFYSVLAWHVLWITYYARLEPKAKAEKVIDDVEKEVLESYSKRKVTTVLEAVMLIGMLGGYLGGSKRYPFPGIKTLWIGIEKLKAMKQGWLLAKSHFLKKYAT